MPPNNKNVGAGLYNIYRPLALWCWVVPPYILDGASHTGQAKIEAGSQVLVVPTELTQSMMIYVFCIHSGNGQS